MAMTDEELLLQMNILATKLESNENMPYKTNTALNKGLNPEYFTGNNTKIVNAINLLAETSVKISDLSEAVANKVNELLLDTSSDANKAIWENVKDLMEMDTIIEGIQRILEGKQQDKVLGITPDDIGKILSVSQAEDGEMMVKAIDMVITNPNDIEYNTIHYPEVQNVAGALDKLFELQKNNNSSGGGSVGGSIEWDAILDKPEIPAKLELNDKFLIMKSETSTMSVIPLMTDEDIDTLMSDLNM